MIGKFLESHFDAAAEDRILTQPFRRGNAGWSTSACLLSVGFTPDGATVYRRCGGYDRAMDLAARYDRLCWRFGEVRVNAAIRNRILANQTRRALSGMREPSPCPVRPA